MRFGWLVMLVACGGGSETDSGSTTPTGTAPTTGTTPTTASATDCAELASADAQATSGLFTLGGAEVWCDLDTPGAVWTRQAEPLRRMGEPIGGKVEAVIADPDILIDDAGTWHLYYQGSRAPALGQEPFEMMIVHGTSPDGRSWTIDEAPVLTAPADPTAWDATHSETPAVVYDPNADPGTEYKLYYSGAVDEHPLEFPWYQVGVAVSGDGVNFTRLPPEFSPYGQAGAMLRAEDVLTDVPGVTGGVLADPEVVLEADGTYHLFVSSFGHDDDMNILAWGILHMVSPDGIYWSPGPDGARPSAALVGQQPSVSFNDTTGLWEMVYTSDADEERLDMPSVFNPSMGVWLATSPDLDTWTAGPARDFWWDEDFEEESMGLLTGAALQHHDGQRHLFYKGWGTNEVPAGSYVPTHTGFEPAALNLLLATRSAD